jgi:hypothetical protein
MSYHIFILYCLYLAFLPLSNGNENITEISNGIKLHPNIFIYINNEHLIMVYPLILFNNLFHKNRE